MREAMLDESRKQSGPVRCRHWEALCDQRRIVPTSAFTSLAVIEQLCIQISATAAQCPVGNSDRRVEVREGSFGRGANILHRLGNRDYGIKRVHSTQHSFDKQRQIVWTIKNDHQ